MMRVVGSPAGAVGEGLAPSRAGASPAPTLVVAVVLIVSALALGPTTALRARAEEEPPPEPRMTEEQAALLEAWEKATTPGEAHRELAAWAGHWKMTVRSWLYPTLPPRVSEGIAIRFMLLDGRVLEERMVSEADGEAFEGVGRIGFDNATGLYWRTWIDNQGTGLFTSTGTRDPEAAATTFTGELVDPMTRSTILVRSVISDQGPDKQVLEWWENRGQGEFKTMEITYERD